MQLTVKTLKGEKFEVTAEPSNTVAMVKAIIEAAKPELPAVNMKLIHSGKVLRDLESIESCNIKPNAFLVVMIAKAKKSAASISAPSPNPTPTETKSNLPVTSDPTPASATSSATDISSPLTESVSPPPSSSEVAPESASNEFPQEVVSNLIAMGFPDAEVRACLRASQGQPDIAVEFLTNGIPPGVQSLQHTGVSSATVQSASGGTTSSTNGEPLAVLRNHPQITQLRRLVQEDPATLQAVLTQIGQQQPELLQEINNNQELFLQIMNEPVQEDAPASAPADSSSSSSSSTRATSANVGPGFLQGVNNPAQMAEMLQNMGPAEVQSLAGLMGLTPEQLTTTAQMISRMPPEEFQNYVNSAMQGGEAAGLMGGIVGSGTGRPGPQILELSQEEMAAVDRLVDMGFDRTDAAQAYIACDKNEALAANLLMDGGFAVGEARGGGGDGSSNNDNDGDDMYN